MAFGIYIFIVTITFSHIEAQTVQSTQPTYGTNLATFSSAQAKDDNTTTESASAIIEFTDNTDKVYENEHNSTVAKQVLIAWNNTTIRSKDNVETEMPAVGFRSSTIPVDSTNSTLASSEALLTYMTVKQEANVSDSHSFEESISSTRILQIGVDESDKESEITFTEDTNITTSSDQWNIVNSSRESRMFSTDATSEQQEYHLIMLKSNCSIVNSENISLSEDLSDVDCTLHLRMNLPSGNATRDQVLRSLNKLNIKPIEFQMVEMYSENEGDASGHKQDKHHGFVLDAETLAYLAVATAFAFLLLLAVMVFGFRCFRKRRPSLDISRFDVRLSNYTLTKIPRASLSATDSLHESDCLDDKPESSAVRNKDCGSCESGLDIIPCDIYTSNREMKTFGVCRPSVSRNSDSPSDMYPQHNTIAYENHTFQRYF